MVSVSGGAAAPLLPEPVLPLVKRAPSPSSWTIEWTSPSGETEKAMEKKRNDIIRVNVQKDGATLREQAFTGTGEVLERWILAGQEFVQKEGRFVYVPSADEGTENFDYQKTDFPRMEWVDMKYYYGISRHEGVPVYLFIRSAQKPDLTKDTSVVMAQCIKQGVPFVFLSAKQLPLLSFDGRIMGKFGGFEPLKGKLEPTAELSQMGARLGEDLKEHRRKPSPP